MGRIFFVLLLCGLIWALPVEDDSADAIDNAIEEDELEERWFEQYLNPFDVTDNRTFYVRYFEEDRFFEPGGPLLLEIGGEGAIFADSLRTGQSYLLAEKLRAKLVLVEHRYYGKSSPYENFTAETMLYLTVEHALEDLAYFVETLKKSPDLKDSKVAVFGCSYPASLATWFRYKFPHLVDAAWASSAPLRAVADFYEYLEVATGVYYDTSPECYDTIKRGYEEARELVATPEGLEGVHEKLGNWGCSNISQMTGEEVLDHIRYVLADHNVPPDHGVTSCSILQTEGNHTAFERLADLILMQSQDKCRIEDEFPNDGLAWDYQICTEFGYIITTTSQKQPFNESYDSIQDSVDSCMYTWGEEFDMATMQRGIDRINRLYGGTDLKTSRVLSVHGTIDPWHRLGLYEQADADSPVILIPGTSHCADQLIDSEEDPPQLLKAKKLARKIMMKWLK